MSGEESENPVLRGIQKAKGLDFIPFASVLAGGVFLFAQGGLAGIIAGTLAFIYAIFWLFANVSGAVLLTVRNWNQTRRELAGGSGARTDDDSEKPVSPK